MGRGFTNHTLQAFPNKLDVTERPWINSNKVVLSITYYTTNATHINQQLTFIPIHNIINQILQAKSLS